MNTSRLLSALILLALGVMAHGQSITLGAPPKLNPDVAATAVVYNENDPESRQLADFYAEKRGIPKEQVVGIKCSVNEEITRAEYDDKVAEPLRQVFTTNSWWKLRDEGDPLGSVESCRIRYLVLMRGVPLKIAPQANYPGDKPYHTSPIGEHNEASVESELSVLSVRARNISGAMNNPYYRSFKTVHDARQPEILLVARLDGPSAPVVRRMIVDAIETEKDGLRGFAYIDARGIKDPGLKEGDDWLITAANTLQRGGVPVILDQGAGMFPDGYPLRNAALYLGWYSEQPAGPFAGTGIRFRPGAIACHIHSFSALTVRHPQARWVGPLLQQGAAVALGNVYEPYLALTPNLDILVDRLRAGFTVGEAVYMSQRVLSWMGTICGDPLYRPYPVLPVPARTPEAAEWDAYREGALKFFTKRADGEQFLKEQAGERKSGLLWEGLGLLQIRASDAAAGIASFEQARKVYQNTDDSLRAAIHEAIQLQGAKRGDDAVALVREEVKQHKDAPAVNILKAIVPAAFPPPATPFPLATPAPPKPAATPAAAAK